MFLYKVNKNGKIYSKEKVNDDYVVKENEFLAPNLRKPRIEGNVIIETITEEEIAQAQMRIDKEEAFLNLQKELKDGQMASLELKQFMKENVNQANWKSARIQLRPVFLALRDGDWDIALDEITLIDDANSTIISRKIKTKIENYLS